MTTDLIVSGFADEATVDKTVDQQFSVMAALGMSYVTLRFLDAGLGIKNVIDLTPHEVDIVRSKLKEYGLQVSSLGTPLGKVKIVDIDDGTRNSYFPFDHYLRDQVTRTCRIANDLNCKLIRGFSFYPPQFCDPWEYIPQAIERIAAMTDVCHQYGLILGLEVEANLIGRDAETLVHIHRQVDSDALVLVFDGANLITQGFNTHQVIQQFHDMQSALGWLHIKDYRGIASGDGRDRGFVDENSLRNFVPVGKGDSGYGEILASLQRTGQFALQRLESRGLSGIFIELEPHLKGGGQYGGFSGADGFGVATRALFQLCSSHQINLELRDFDSISA